jgi:hypothetical protein
MLKCAVEGHLRHYRRLFEHNSEHKFSDDTRAEHYYVEQIQPLLRDKKVREIAEAMKVSKPYAAFVRSGRRRPHPRHWNDLAQLVGVLNP